MNLANKHLAAGLICEKMFNPIETTCDLSLFSADERRLIETIVQSIMKNMDMLAVVLSVFTQERLNQRTNPCGATNRTLLKKRLKPFVTIW